MQRHARTDGTNPLHDQAVVSATHATHISPAWLGGLCLLIALFWLGVSTAMAASYSLTVNKGSGGGAYASGQVVFIHANPYDSTDPARSVDETPDATSPLRVFSHWSGDIRYLASPNEPDSQLTMPAANVSLTANYKDVPRWSMPKVVSSFPANPSAVIYLFHGGGDNCGAACIVRRTHVRNFIDEAASRGFGVVAIQGYDQSNQSWDENPDPAVNLDMQRVAAVRNDLIARGQMSASLPAYMVGISGGGLFASRFNQHAAAAVGFVPVASALFISPGDYASIASSNVPTIFMLAEQDPLNGPALESFNAMLSNGVPTQQWTLPATPLYPERFWRVDGLSADDSRAIYSAYKNSGMLDANDYLLVNPNVGTAWRDVIPSEYNNYSDLIQLELIVAYAEHGFYSNYNKRVFDFFASPSVLVDGDPAINSFSPAGARDGAYVTINGQDLLGVTAVRFNGVEASIVNGNTNTLVVTVPAGASSGPIEVVTALGSAFSGVPFEVYKLATISGFTPNKGPVGTAVVVTGTNFDQATAVDFSGVPASFVVNSATQLTTIVPAGIASKTIIKVTTAAGVGYLASPFTLSNLKTTSTATATRRTKGGGKK